MREPDERRDIGLRYLSVMTSLIDEVDEVLVFEEGTRYCAAAVVHVAHVVVKRRQFLNKIFDFTYCI